MVHLSNTITQHRPVAVGESLMLEVHASPLHPHPKGTAVDFLATASVDGTPVWESTSTYLRRGPSDESVDSPASDDHVVPGRVTWRLPGDLGRRYAGVSGDHNPLHLHPLTARALGYRRPIAHGMWSLARCVAALENRLPGAVTVEAAFKKPIPLPGTVAFGQDPVDGGEAGIDFALSRPEDGAPHLVGRTRAVA
jgi:acyl dehydratase